MPATANSSNENISHSSDKEDKGPECGERYISYLQLARKEADEASRRVNTDYSLLHAYVVHGRYTASMSYDLAYQFESAVHQRCKHILLKTMRNDLTLSFRLSLVVLCISI